MEQTLSLLLNNAQQPPASSINKLLNSGFRWPASGPKPWLWTRPVCVCLCVCAHCLLTEGHCNIRGWKSPGGGFKTQLWVFLLIHKTSYWFLWLKNISNGLKEWKYFILSLIWWIFYRFFPLAVYSFCSYMVFVLFPTKVQKTHFLLLK